jgi:hypothetical protein
VDEIEDVVHLTSSHFSVLHGEAELEAMKEKRYALDRWPDGDNPLVDHLVSLANAPHLFKVLIKENEGAGRPTVTLAYYFWSILDQCRA